MLLDDLSGKVYQLLAYFLCNLIAHVCNSKIAHVCEFLEESIHHTPFKGAFHALKVRHEEFFVTIWLSFFLYDGVNEFACNRA